VRIPKALRDESIRTDAQKGIVRRRLVKNGHLGIGEERVRPPESAEHLVTDAQLVLVARAREVEARVVPVLTEIEVQREVLRQPFKYRCDQWQL